MNLSLRPYDSPDLIIWPCSEAHLASFVVIQTHPSCRFHLAVDFPALRLSGSWSQIINRSQTFPEQFPRRRHLGQLERDILAMATTLAPILTSYSRNVLIDQCSTAFGKASVRMTLARL